MIKSPNAWRQLAAVSLVALVAGCGSMKPHQAEPIKSTSTQTTYVFMRSQTSVGPVVSTSNGMTLYTYDKDAMEPIRLLWRVCPELAALSGERDLQALRQDDDRFADRWHPAMGL